MNSIIEYLRSTRGELKHVSWPTQRQTVIYTTLVVAISIVTGVYLGVLDFGLTKIIAFQIFWTF